MMQRILDIYDRAIALVSSRIPQALTLLLVRLALAGVFWRSARTKLEEGSWLTLSDTTVLLFQEEYGMPAPEITGMIAMVAEHVLPILIVLGLLTRFGAAGLLVMTLVIQFFVYPEAWWPVHSLWVALTLVLIANGAGLLSLDQLLARKRPAIAA
jgi:putative oxidoreductase